MRRLGIFALAFLLASCSSTGKVYPSSGTIVPNATFQLTSTIAYSLEQIALTGAGAWLLYNIYDPLAPNWEIVEAKVSEDVYVLDLKMKRFHTGGAGEAMLLIRRRAEQLRAQGGFASYRVVDYYEGIESSTPIAQRFAQGIIQMARSK